MPKGIDRFVSENRRATKRIDSTFVEVSSRRRRQFNFGVSRFQVPTSIEVYTRPLNGSLVSGHPEAEHGSGRGVSGDVRGSWTLVTDEEMTEAFVTDGRNAIRDSLDGQESGSISEIAVGSGTNDALTSNTTLQSETGRDSAWAYQGSSSNSTEARCHFLFGEYGENISEFGVLSGNNQLFNRITTTTVTPDKSQEVRIDILFEIGASGVGNSAITMDGRNAVAETIRSPNTVVGLEEYAFGDDSTSPTIGDTSLGNELFTKAAERQIEPEKITAHTVVFEVEPAGQPYTIREIGIKDNTGRLIWRTVVEEFDKDDTTEFEVYAGFRAK